jgi:hypothetical protein
MCSFVMTRLLLTLLALLTGLVAHTAPAQARMCLGSKAEVGAVEAPRSGTRVVVRDASIGAPAAQRETGDCSRECAWPPEQIVYLPTVHLGVDRALE